MLRCRLSGFKYFSDKENKGLFFSVIGWVFISLQGNISLGKKLFLLTHQTRINVELAGMGIRITVNQAFVGEKQSRFTVLGVFLSFYKEFKIGCLLCPLPRYPKKAR